MARPSFQSVVFHPVLFALYPGVNLLAQNIHELRLEESYRALALVTAGAIVL